MSGWAWAPLGAALIALVGVAITIGIQNKNFKSQLRSSHAVKIAEMRQAWINDLRRAMSKFQSYGVTPEIEHANHREFYEAGTQIELMMNPKDPDFAELQLCLYKFLEAKGVEEKYSSNAQYIEVCQRILKREWETLKQEVKGAG